MWPAVRPLQSWEAKRDERVSGWHEYMKTGGKKQAGVKPPKMKTNDEVRALTRTAAQAYLEERVGAAARGAQQGPEAPRQLFCMKL